MEDLLERERMARIDNDYEEIVRIFQGMMDLCTSDEELLGLVRILSIKRGQNRIAIKWMIRELFDKKQDEEGFVDFFSSVLRDVIEGRIFLEEERIYITEELKGRYESCGDIESGLDVIINVPVETFTLVEEKVIIRYQLEQLRLCISNLDWIRADITLKKIRKKYFECDGTQDVKIKFYELVVLLYLGQKKYFDAADVYHTLSGFVADKSHYVVLSSFFCILTTCEMEMMDITSKRMEMLHRLSEDKNNDEAVRSIVIRFLSRLVLDKSMINDVQNAFSSSINASLYLGDLDSAVDEHNLNIIQEFYSSISIQDMPGIMQNSVEDIIRKISFMVNHGFVKCRINQKTGIIEFKKRKWNDDVGNVMDKLIRCNHLIHKERLRSSTYQSIKPF